MNLIRVLFMLLMFSIVSCQINSQARFKNHERPDLTVDDKVFDTTGCTLNKYGWYDCEAYSTLFKASQCERFQIEPLLGGLYPSFPIAFCDYYYDDYSLTGTNDECIFNTGGFIQDCRRLIVFKDGKYQIIQDAQTFRSLFAPVTSPEEALGFALALKNVSAYYGQTIRPDYEYEPGILEDTYVEPIQDGYIVHAFNYQVFSCPPHYTYAVSIKVSKNGEVEEISRYPIFYDPTKNMCVD